MLKLSFKWALSHRLFCHMDSTLTYSCYSKMFSVLILHFGQAILAITIIASTWKIFLRMILSRVLKHDQTFTTHSPLDLAGITTSRQKDCHVFLTHYFNSIIPLVCPYVWPFLVWKLYFLHKFHPLSSKTFSSPLYLLVCQKVDFSLIIKTASVTNFLLLSQAFCAFHADPVCRGKDIIKFHIPSIFSFKLLLRTCSS